MKIMERENLSHAIRLDGLIKDLDKENDKIQLLKTELSQKEDAKFEIQLSVGNGQKWILTDCQTVETFLETIQNKNDEQIKKYLTELEKC